MMFALGALILTVSANLICVRHSDNSCSWEPGFNDCFMNMACYADATCDCGPGGGGTVTVTVRGPDGPDGPVGPAPDRECVRHRDDNKCKMTSIDDSCVVSAGCYVDSTCDCTEGGGGGDSTEAIDCTDSVMSGCMDEVVKAGLCDILEYEELIGADMPGSDATNEAVTMDGSDGSDVDLEDALDDFNDAMAGLEDAMEDALKQALERSEDVKQMTKIFEKVEKKQSDTCKRCYDMDNDNTDFVSDDEFWKKCQDEVNWEFNMHKDANEKCHAVVLTTGDCGGSCETKDCEALCEADFRCKYFAIFENGTCETYDSCSTTASVGEEKVSIYSKQATKKKSSDSDNTGLIVGVVVGVLVGCILLAVGVVCCMKKSKTVD